MIKLGLANSRMKDFYDVWTIVNPFQIKPENITPIINEVFANRKTIIEGFPKAFSKDFYNSSKTLKRWSNFLKEIGHEEIPFVKVISDIKKFFLPISKKNKTL